jgi:hypothetical protein
MRKKVSRLFATLSLGLLIAAGLFVGYFPSQSYSLASDHPVGSAVFEEPSLTVGLVPPDSINEIAGYRTWTRVNAEPQLMPDQVSALCAAPVPSRADAPTNPHRHKYLMVYVNDTGRKAMLEQKNPAFPEGSVIVKEKLSEKSSQTPELLTVMIKHGKGFNSTSGDWEYMVVDGTGTNVSAQGKLENCQSCHSAKPETDYVFRTYLPREVMTKLK